MPTSQNGWSASPTLKRRSLVVAGVTFVGGIVDNDDVATVLGYVATQFHKRVEPLKDPGCWGFYYRANRNDPTSLSNHSSGTAIDINAPAHPNAVSTAKTFTPAQIVTVHKILMEVGNVVRWGGDYTKTVDAMHFEINASSDAVAKVAARLRVPPVKAPKKPKGAPGKWAKFLHLSPYSLNNSVAGLIKGRRLGYTAVDLDFHMTADGIWANVHWGDLREHKLNGRKVSKSVGQLPWSVVKEVRDSKGRHINSAEHMLRVAKRLGYKRVEVEPKDIPTVDQFKRLKKHADATGIEVVVKRLTDIKGAAKCLANANAAGLTTMVLPRGSRQLSLKRFAEVDYVRGSVKWVA